MTSDDPDADARRFAHESVAAGDPTGWFDRLYAAAADGQAIVPWDRGAGHPMFLQWAEAAPLHGDGLRAVVVGCGTGENAEYLAKQGFDTIAFDISPAAVRMAQERFPHSPVDYLVADLLDVPVGWRHAFDLVVEIFTVQSLPPTLHAPAIINTGLLVRPGGTLLVVAAAADTPPEQDAGPPWSLTRDEVTAFASGGLDLVGLEDLPGPVPGNRRWRAEFRRAPGG
jgi:SAM-dependent methyltransferase